VFSGHANVQTQGSTAKGTSLISSDWDFFIHFDNTLLPATKNQRLQVCSLLSTYLHQAGIIHNEPQLGANRINLTNVSMRSESLPDVDIIFEKFKGDVRLPPNSSVLADSHVCQQVCG